MPTTLVLRFPRGRYQATPWGRHPEEGAVELPPSPWRLLRALYAVWRTRAPELDQDTVHALLARLAVPATFHIPRHSVTRDGFAVFERDAELAAVWPFELPGNQRAALERLAGSIPYFGRADSLCSGCLPMEWEPGPHETWVPVDVADSVDDNTPVTSLLAPELPLHLDALLARPAEVRRDGLPFPAGSHLVGYQRTHPAPRPRSQWRRTIPPTAVRFSVLQAELPPQTDSLIYTDLLRQGALSALGGLREERTRTLLGGRTADDRTMQGHRHAHYLPLCTNRRLTGLLVWVPSGLPHDELKALTSVRRLYSPAHPNRRLIIRSAGLGTPADLAPELTAPTNLWRSLTPFTPSRYPPRNTPWPEFLRAEVTRELTNRGLPSPHTVILLDEQWQPWRRYRPSARTRRDPRQGQATRAAAFLHVELTKPITGPLALGHLSHFGLGLFTPEPQP